MGDRCYVYGQVRKKDWGRFSEIFDLDQSNVDLDNGGVNSVAFTIEELNYGPFDGGAQATEEGLVFVTYSDAGGSYDRAGIFSTGDRVYREVLLNGEREICIALSATTPTPIPSSSMERAVEAWHAEKKCWRIFQDPAGAGADDDQGGDDGVQE